MKKIISIIVFLTIWAGLFAADKVYTTTVWDPNHEDVLYIDNAYILPGCKVAFRRNDGADKDREGYFYFGAEFDKDIFWCDSDLNVRDYNGNDGIGVGLLSKTRHHWVGFQVYDNEALDGTKYVDFRSWRYKGVGPKDYHATKIYALCYKYKVNYNANGYGVTNLPSNWTSATTEKPKGWVTAGYDSSHLQKVIISGAAPSRTGYDFLGWYTEASGGSLVEGGTEYTFSNPVHNSENGNVLNLYAHWQVHSHSLSASFVDSAAGTVTNASQTKDYGQSWSNVTFTPKSGYIITGVTVNGTPVSGWTSSSYTYSGIVPDNDIDIKVSTVPVHTLLISVTGLSGNDSAIFTITVSGETYSYASACKGSYNFSLSPQKSYIYLTNVVDGSSVTLTKKSWSWAYNSNVPATVSQTLSKTKPEIINVATEFYPKQTWSHTENHKEL